MTFRQFAFRNVSRNKRTYAAFFLSSMFSVMVFFVYAAFIFNPAIQKGDIHQYAVVAMTVAEYIIYLFSILFVFYSVSAFLKSRKREFGVLMMHGMTYGQLRSMIFIENMVIGIASIVFGLAAGLLFAKLFIMAGARMMKMGQLPFYVPVKAMIVTCTAFILLFLVISIFNAMLVKVSKPVDLLKGTAKPKPEPKASLVRTIIAAVLILAGYTASVLAKGAMVVVVFIPVTIVVIIGTYLLFSQLSVFVIRSIRHRRSLFLRKTNVLLFSDLAYRMKDNARMFFIITVITTVSICAMGTFTGFLETMHKQINNAYPFTYSLAINKGASEQHMQEQAIEDELKSRHIQFDKRQATLSIFQSKGSRSATLVKASEYNTLAQELGYPQLALRGKEAAAIWSMPNLPLSQRWSIPGTSSVINVTEIVNTPMFPPFIGEPVLIVTDETLDKLQEPAKAYTFIAFQTDQAHSTAEIGEAISKRLTLAESDSNLFFSPAELISNAESGYRLMLFAGLFVSCVFFVASGSFLYFRLFTDLNDDKQKYQSISKLGITEGELSKVATSQLGLLFFVPYVVALLHSAVALYALHNILMAPVTRSAVTVCSIFLGAQLIYFLVIRFRYLKHLKRAAF